MSVVQVRSRAHTSLAGSSCDGGSCDFMPSLLASVVVSAATGAMRLCRPGKSIEGAAETENRKTGGRFPIDLSNILCYRGS